MFKELPLKKSHKYPEPFSCKITQELKLLMDKADCLGLEVADVARISLEVGFIEAIKRKEQENLEKNKAS